MEDACFRVRLRQALPARVGRWIYSRYDHGVRLVPTDASKRVFSSERLVDRDRGNRASMQVFPNLAHYGGNRPEHNLQIEPKRPPSRILDIETHHFFEGRFIFPANLPEAGHSGNHVKAPSLPGFELT